MYFILSDSIPHTRPPPRNHRIKISCRFPGNSGRFPFFKIPSCLSSVLVSSWRWWDEEPSARSGYLKEILTHWLEWSENKSGWLEGLLYGLREKNALCFLIAREWLYVPGIWDSAATPRAKKILKILSICRCDSVSASFRDDVSSPVGERNRTWRLLQKFAR